jgi:acyl-CoA hydrolase
MSKYSKEYAEKLTTADEAVKVVKNGDGIAYSHFVLRTPLLDEALAFRKTELEDIDVTFVTLTYVPEIARADPKGEVFGFEDGSFSAATRGIAKMGIPVTPIPSLYHETGSMYKVGAKRSNVLFLAVRPMDDEGMFNLGPESSFIIDLIKYKGGVGEDFKVLVEVNDKIPHVYGDNHIHISDVHAIVENPNSKKLMAIPDVKPTEVDKRIAGYIMDEMVDGACLQLGIGGMPNFVGQMLVDSDFKDLSCHSEMFVNAYMRLHQAGKLNNKKKQIDVGKSLFTFAMGSDELYDFIDGNPEMSCRAVSYTNDPGIIAQNDRVYSICSCIEVDLFGNVSSESVGYKQISGTGGQLDYHFASMHSEGGKGFLCMPSAKKGRDGKLTSNICLNFKQGTQITVPANMVNYIVTEYGIVNLKGKNVWERVELLASIAHPDFRDSLLEQAKDVGIFKRNNRQIMSGEGVN